MITKMGSRKKQQKEQRRKNVNSLHTDIVYW